MDNEIFGERFQTLEKQLATIESLLRQMPEVMSGTFLVMQEQVRRAKLQGKQIEDVFELIPK